MAGILCPRCRSAGDGELHPAEAPHREDLVMRDLRAGLEELAHVYDAAAVSVGAGPPGSKRRKTSATEPRRIGSPSRSGTTPSTRRPCTNVPFLLPRSSRRAAK